MENLRVLERESGGSLDFQGFYDSLLWSFRRFAARQKLENIVPSLVGEQVFLRPRELPPQAPGAEEEEEGEG